LVPFPPGGGGVKNKKILWEMIILWCPKEFPST
jgi:hypothetical protein